MGTGTPETNQHLHWDNTYVKKADFFGTAPSDFGVRAAATFEQHGLRRILELGCGQGRDTFLFLQRGFDVTALDYAEAGLRQMQERAAALGVDKALALQPCDVRKGVPFPDQSFDGCFSHMFFTMQLSEKELEHIFGEVLRVLKPGGLNIYSVRNDHDPHCGKGKHMGEEMWQNPMGFVVHFFSAEKVKRLAKGYDLLVLNEFDDPSPPFTKKLYEVVLRKPGKA
jgi:SAM-dependent methyltransferase